MILRPFRDFPQGTVLSLLRQSYEHYAAMEPDCFRKWNEGWKHYDSEICLYPDTIGACGFISCLGDTVIGFGSWDPRQFPERGIIGHNCILPAFRGKGYGKMQMIEILGRFRVRGFGKAVVTTGEAAFFEPARRMYRSCGFKEIGRFTDPTSGSKMIEYETSLDGSSI